MLAFAHTFSTTVHPNDLVVLAVSGGVDSMVLLDLVCKFHPSENIIVAHFDHALRGEESDGDREFVADFCKSKSISFESKKVDVASIAEKKKKSLEAIARQERYQFLEQVRAKYNAKYILTAHHADDQMETIILNLIKGGKAQGLSGIFALSGHIFRPLLGQTKAEILHYAKSCNIPFREDSSNTDLDFERNKIRHAMIPTLIEINPSIHRTFGNLAKFMQEITEFFDSESKGWLLDAEKTSGKPKTFLIAEFIEVHPFFQRELIAELYREAHDGSSQGLSSKLITELIRFISDKNSYGVKDIGKLHLERRGERVFIKS